MISEPFFRWRMTVSPTCKQAERVGQDPFFFGGSPRDRRRTLWLHESISQPRYRSSAPGAEPIYCAGARTKRVVELRR